MEYDKDDIKRLGVTLYQLACGMDYNKIGLRAIQLVELLQQRERDRNPVRETVRLPIRMNGNYIELSGPNGYSVLCHIGDVSAPSLLPLAIKAIILALQGGKENG